MHPFRQAVSRCPEGVVWRTVGDEIVHSRVVRLPAMPDVEVPDKVLCKWQHLPAWLLRQEPIRAAQHRRHLMLRHTHHQWSRSTGQTYLAGRSPMQRALP